MFRFKERPASTVERVNGVRFAADRLNAVELAGDHVIRALERVVDVAVVVIIGGAEAEYEDVAPLKFFGELRVLEKIRERVTRLLNVEARVVVETEDAQTRVARTDESLGRKIDVVFARASEELAERSEFV